MKRLFWLTIAFLTGVAIGARLQQSFPAISEEAWARFERDLENGRWSR